jgi:RNA polymerase sigma-70 factor (ECF subfamily)
VLPTTVWTTIALAGAHDRDALEEFSRRYRPAILRYVEGRGFRGADGDDLCQEVFLRVIQGGVLAKADPARGRFRGLLLTVTMRVIQDRLRQRRLPTTAEIPAAQQDHDFDQAWAWHLTERALARLRERGSPYYQVLVDHVCGRPQNRNKLWIARRQLSSLIRQEVAFTCADEAEYRAELSYLARYLRPEDLDETAQAPDANSEGSEPA